MDQSQLASKTFCDTGYGIKWLNIYNTDILITLISIEYSGMYKIDSQAGSMYKSTSGTFSPKYGR